METNAIVISAEGEFAIVETGRKSACDGCHRQQDGQGCAMCTLLGDKAALRTRARNPLGAKPGDKVRLETASARVLGYGAMVFILPLGLAGLGWTLGGMLPLRATGQAVAALCGFVGAFVGAWFYSRRIAASRCDVTITAILPQDDEERNTPGVS